METVLKADIFFFIASVAIIILTLLFSVLLFYLILAGRILYKLAARLKSGFRESEEFISELKERLENNPVFNFFFPSSRKRQRSNAKDDSIKRGN